MILECTMLALEPSPYRGRGRYQRAAQVTKADPPGITNSTAWRSSFTRMRLSDHSVQRYTSSRSIQQQPTNRPGEDDTPVWLLSNFQSLTISKLDELNLLIEGKASMIIMLTESWLTDYMEESLLVENYNRYTANPKDCIGRRVTVFAHDSLDVKVVRNRNRKTSSLWINAGNHHHITSWLCLSP